MDSRYYLLAYSDMDYRYMGRLYFTLEATSDDPSFPGLFDVTTYRGHYSAEYVVLDQNGDMKTEDIYSSYETYSEEEGAIEINGVKIVETGRTEDEALFNEYRRLGIHSFLFEGLWEPQGVLDYYSPEEIREMGWEAFLRAYGFSSHLTLDDAQELQGAQDTSPISQEPMPELSEDDMELLQRVAFGLYYTLPKNNDGYYDQEALRTSLRDGNPANSRTGFGWTNGDNMEEFLHWVLFYGEDFGRLHVTLIYDGSADQEEFHADPGNIYEWDAPDIDEMLQNLFSLEYDFNRLPEYDAGQKVIQYHFYGGYVGDWELASVVQRETETEISCLVEPMSSVSVTGGAARVVIILEGADNLYGFRIKSVTIITL